MISLMRRSIIFLHNHLANEHALQELPRVLPPFLNATYNFIHTSNEAYKTKPDKNDIVIAKTTFEHVKDRKREVYLDILRAYKKENISRRGHVEFIKLALKYMKEFGVHKDLESYKSLLDVFPKGVMIPRNKYQAMFEYYPKQQDVACLVLDQMEDFNVLPDGEMEELLLNTFGRHSTVLKKFWRIMYWMPKFKNINPWLPPNPLPTDPREIARFAIQKICFDVKTEISEFDTKTVKDAVDHTWIISGMSPLQEDLLQSHPLDVPVYVEGPTKVWVNSFIAIDYFVLRRDTIERPKLRKDPDDVSDLKIRFWDKAEISLPHTIHEQDDGTYLAVCATGTSSKDSLLSWIRCLEVKNPILSKIPVLFTFISSSSQKMYIDEGFQKPLIPNEVEQSQVDER